MIAAALTLAVGVAAAHAEDAGAALIRRTALAVATAEAKASRPHPPRWDGSFGGFVLRGLYGSYRSVFAASDLAVCNFEPTCSAFSEQAVGRFGLLRGALLSADRLLRDHPWAVGWYPADAATGRFLDPPARYEAVTAPKSVGGGE